jgi:hypothetical protein
MTASKSRSTSAHSMPPNITIQVIVSSVTLQRRRCSKKRATCAAKCLTIRRSATYDTCKTTFSPKDHHASGATSHHSIIAVLSALSGLAFAGAPPGILSSNAPFSKAHAPGESFTFTLTASSVPGGSVLTFNLPFTFSTATGQFQVTGGTCTTPRPYSEGNSCTIIVQFLGSAPGTFSADWLGRCQAVSGFGGHSIVCSTAGAGTPGTLAAFMGNGIAGTVDTLGKEGLALLLTALLATGALFTLHKPT